MKPFGRRIVTGPEGITSDGPADKTIDIPGGFAVSEVLWLDGPATDVADGRDRVERDFPLEPPPGGASARLIRLPATGSWLRVEGDTEDLPGMHTTDTLDFMVVLEGEVVLGMGGGSETTVRAGDYVVQRGTPHRWRVAGGEPCTYFVAMLRPDAGAAGTEGQWLPGDPALPRRLVTDGDGFADGNGTLGLSAGSASLVDLWHTGGALAHPRQGGDPEGPWALEPPTSGVSFRQCELQPGPPMEAGWHQTRTIDIDLLLSGRLGLDLPDGVSVELGPGDIVLQRGTDHRWRVIGDEPARFATVMFALT
jgi:quercetin dioxygenase-like cupin family protein